MTQSKPGPADAAGTPNAMPPRHILIADDSPDVTDATAMLLEEDGHRVTVVHDGLAAVEAVARERPDIALLDIAMPGLDGYDTCRLIRETEWGRGMTILAVSGWGRPEDRRQALDAGFDDHLVKPFDPTALLARIARLRRS